MITESQISLICLRIAHVASSTAQVFVIRIIANLTARGVVALDLFNIIDALVLTSVSVLAALSDLGTILPEHERNRTACKTQEG